MSQQTTTRSARPRRASASTASPSVDEQSQSAQDVSEGAPERRQRVPRPPKLRVVTPRNIISTPVLDLVAGMITEDGVITRVAPLASRSGVSLGVEVRFASGRRFVESHSGSLDVLAKLAKFDGSDVDDDEDDDE